MHGSIHVRNQMDAVVPRQLQRYVDLGGFSTISPADPADVLGQFLRALGVPSEQVPVSLQESPAFRSVTAEKSLAIFLDNAFSRAQVVPLLPDSPESVVVVASRHRLGSLHAEGAAVELRPLDQAASVELLAELVGEDRARSEPASARLVARPGCGW
ncbi:hypothetical protein [Allokutzneria albata]|uniref:hypothetical protein n=1 Tax=Allokutzneria albata TaxID=211114 RepID=UPI0012DC0EA8|nr:hypothetical protein [Allokutzneria albata]